MGLRLIALRFLEHFDVCFSRARSDIDALGSASGTYSSLFLRLAGLGKENGLEYWPFSIR